MPTVFRFYCVPCDKIKRARVMPLDVVDTSNPDPLMRHGTCRYHTSTARANDFSRVPAKHVNVKHRPAPAAAKPPKPSKKRPDTQR
jgi:hypothetical protein